VTFELGWSVDSSKIDGAGSCKEKTNSAQTTPPNGRGALSLQLIKPWVNHVFIVSVVRLVLRA
jgi:hypothetical protein